ncbi:NitT/TauT family transport system permease protein [Allocatelliglobosispora scoriae]|uniref:NitT/TauT family transport system permease protein n=1 Tax=Allocatelliglobosispora scoriae TaxID=643052 RepID=A0A841BJM0_9ACTN|nr:ABC transporter permease [Allocatelliglobosispora scoriae]MBB5869307.1 NitT/TauT family transport system permease protein [Allocatelliglobosispora scoriae]
MATELRTRDTTLTGLDALELAGRSGRRSLGHRTWAATWPKLVALAIFIGFWQIVVESGWRDPWILPGPAVVGEELWRQLQTANLWEGVFNTMNRALLGFGISVLGGSLLGFAVARVKVLRAGIGSMITALQTLPSVAWFPFAILIFGLNESAIFFVVVMGAAPSIANGVISGIDYVPPIWLRAGKNIGARGLSLYRFVVTPAALPAFIAGLKQGWAFSWRSLMAGELLSIIPGMPALGVQMTAYRDLSNAKGLLATLVVIFFIGILVDAIFGVIERSVRRRRGLAEA